jgi:hypothetical protein
LPEGSLGFFVFIQHAKDFALPAADRQQKGHGLAEGLWNRVGRTLEIRSFGMGLFRGSGIAFSGIGFHDKSPVNGSFQAVYDSHHSLFICEREEIARSRYRTSYGYAGSLQLD